MTFKKHALTLDTADAALQQDFRRRALVAAVLVNILGGVCYVAAKAGAPHLYQGLSVLWGALPWQILAGLVAVGVLVTLWQRRYKQARLLAIAQTIMIIWSWGLAQFPYLVPPDLTLANTAVPASVLQPLLVALVAGAIVLVPSFWYLYSIFLSQTSRDQIR